MSELKPCPICHASPEIGYACGDYFTHCSDGCLSPMCDHPTKSQTICSWNDWATWYERRYQEPNEPLTLEQLRGMDGEPVWVETMQEWRTVYIGVEKDVRLYSILNTISAKHVLNNDGRIYARKPESVGRR